MVPANLKRLLMGSHWITGVAAVSIIAFIWLQCVDISSHSFSHASEELHREHDSSSLPILSFNNIYFAHIGKAGGE